MTLVHHSGRVEVVARRLYREWMADDYENYPWDDNNLPSNETERVAREYATMVVEALDEYDGDGLPRDRLRDAALKVLRHFGDARYGGGYAPLGPQKEVDADVRGLQNALGDWS